MYLETEDEATMTTFDTPLVEEPKRKRARKLICRCGHAEANHVKNPSPPDYCIGGKETCPCSAWKAVLTPDDARDFMYGAGEGAEDHPLVMGIRRATTKGHKWRWLDGEGCCDLPGCSRNAAKAVWSETQFGITLLICAEHMKGR